MIVLTAMRPVRSSGLAAALTIVGVLALAGSAAAKDLRYTDILRELTDLDRLTVFEPGVFGEGGENGLGTAEAGLEQPAGGVWFGHD